MRVCEFIIATLIIVVNILFFSCDNDAKNKPGLQTIDNLCFTADGGNTSDQLYANDNWSFRISEGNSDWFTVSPSSGGASEKYINLIFKATVNNNPDGRSATLFLTIGAKKYTYNISQDGTNTNICTN